MTHNDEPSVDHKLYRPCRHVPITCDGSLVDFLCLHLCLGMSLIRAMVYTMDSLVVGPMCKNELQVEPLPGIGFLITYKGKRVTVKISKDMSVICKMHLPNNKRSRVRLQPKHTVEQLGDAHTTARFDEHEQGYDAWNQPHLGAVDNRFSSESFKLFIDHLFAADHPNQGDDDDGSGGGA